MDARYSVIRAAAVVSALLGAMASDSLGGDARVRCLTGNARRRADNSRVGGSYSVLMPGLTSAGWPKGPA